jgi:hypothetical protein
VTIGREGHHSARHSTAPPDGIVGRKVLHGDTRVSEGPRNACGAVDPHDAHALPAGVPEAMDDVGGHERGVEVVHRPPHSVDHALALALQHRDHLLGVVAMERHAHAGLEGRDARSESLRAVGTADQRVGQRTVPPVHGLLLNELDEFDVGEGFRNFNSRHSSEHSHAATMRRDKWGANGRPQYTADH